MARHTGLLSVGIACLAAGVLFYALAIAGAYFEKATPPNDIGLYSVTVVLVAFGAAALLLRWAKVRAAGPAE